MMEAAVLLIFPVLMGFAGASDLLTMTISNRVSILLGLGFALVAFGLQLPTDLVWGHLSCALVILTLTFGMFCKGWIGGGDAKLATATALWFGWNHVLDYILISSLIGGAMSLFLLQIRQHTLPDYLMRAAFVARLHDAKTGVPYGIALAISGLIIYPESVVWLKAIGAHGLETF